MENKEEHYKQLAGQLRKPEGEWGKETGRQMNVNNRKMNELGIEALELSSHDTVLEIGMGNGHFVKEILGAAAGITYTGCDYSETMVQEAMEMNRDAADKARFMLATAKDLPLEENTFTKALTVNTIYFMENPVAELSEIRRVLKPGGQLVIVIRPRSCMDSLPFVKHGFTTYDKEDVSALLEKSGYKHVQVSEFDEGLREFGDASIPFSIVTVKGFKE